MGAPKNRGPTDFRGAGDNGQILGNVPSECETGCRCGKCRKRFLDSIDVPDLPRERDPDDGSDDPTARRLGARALGSELPHRACPATEECGSARTSEEQGKDFIVDSGCTAHCSGQSENELEGFVSRSESISLGNAEHRVESFGRGDLGPLTKVMWAPGMSFSMVSVSALDTLGSYAVFGGGKCVITQPSASAAIAAAMGELEPEGTLLTATLRRRLYHVDMDSFGEEAMAPAEASRGSGIAPSEAPYTFGANRREIKGSFGSTRPGSTAGLNALQLLHLRTGHASKATLMAGLKKNAFRGSQTTYAACLPLEIGACEGCLKGGMRADSVPAGHRDISELKPMQEIGTDPVSLSTVSLDGNSVLNMGVCYGTKFMWAYPAKTDGHQSE
ncbi:hypothetical protein B484DRAFT_469847, partial [Ochromonadaceae sp. CCMP2298]